jgi:hypothetical protein
MGNACKFKYRFVEEEIIVKRFLKRHAIALVILATGHSSGLRAQILKTTDVSSDAPSASTMDPNDPNPSAPTGRVITIVIYPTNESTRYAASESAGVWKSVDAGLTWQQFSNGLRSGITQEGPGASLAIDPVNPARLLYATQNANGRLVSYGGLWVPADAAGSWQHVRRCATDQSISSVVFAGDTPYVSTSCGIFTTGDPDLRHSPSWHELPGVPRDLTFPILATLLPDNNVLFACQGTSVHRKQIPSSPTPAWENLPVFLGGCRGLAVVRQQNLPVHNTAAVVTELDATDGSQVTACRAQVCQ